MLEEMVNTLVRVPHLMERVVQEDKTPEAVVEEWQLVLVSAALVVPVLLSSLIQPDKYLKT
tara:strand:- start:22 stop:204 length:183 start_codon:yes stop_codon:yes gene_type:complete